MSGNQANLSGGSGQLVKEDTDLLRILAFVLYTLSYPVMSSSGNLEIK